ncbi:MAG: 3-dehydroquinate synthase [Candidatus Methanomethyliales bacterium]|nr:3-dehydroquinate synthase [Candidatus Methanomethylicales archaeon]
METITVNLGRRSYSVHIGNGLLSSVGRYLREVSEGEKVVVLTVPPVRGLYGRIVEDSLSNEGLDYFIIEVPDGEGAKSFESYLEVVNALLEHNVGREAVIASFGGGCVGDLAGFVAATYMRGTKLAHIPTTLLAQVDSSIGGKVAINHPLAKNLIGTFYQPKLVVTDVGLLKTLPPREIRNGIAELIKYGAILNSSLFSILEQYKDDIKGLQSDLIERIVSIAIKIKADVVAIDEFDKNARMLLNFGHTVGHALESATSYSYYSHGEAVGVGMVVEGRISNRLGLLSHRDLHRMESLISAYGLSKRARRGSVEGVLTSIYHDKKVRSGKLRFAVPTKIGEGTVITDPPEEIITSSLEEVMCN